jgi:hypothetical protein
MRILAWALIACLLSSFTQAATEVYPKSQIKPGLHGVVRTVLQGTEIVSVQTEIVGLQKDAIGPGLDLIIGRLVDPKTALTGAVHGMSGSPLYIDGKMAGALSRRVATFEKDGICGFTPLEDMLQVDQRVRERTGQPDSTSRSGWDGFSPLRTGGGSAFRSEALSLPLSVGGVVPERLQALLNRLKVPAIFTEVSGSTGRAEGLVSGDQLQAGAPVGAVFMTGDLRLGATGTLTWREGNRVLGFGHPMFGFGATNIPMATATILTTIASYQTPYKMANLGSVVGTILQDRMSAIGGLVGQAPSLADFTIEREHLGQKRRTLHGQFAPLAPMMPGILATALLSALDNGDDASRIVSSTIEGEMVFEGKPVLHLGGTFSGQDNEAMSALVETIQPVLLLYQQHWDDLKAKSLVLRVRTEEKQSVWTLKDLKVNTTTAHPGQRILVRAGVRERFGGERTVTFSVDLPESLKQGRVGLRVVGARELEGEKLDAHLGSIRSTEQLIRLFNRRRSNNAVYLQVTTRAYGRIVQEQVQPSLPGSVESVMQGGSETSVESETPVMVWRELKETLPGLVQGEQNLEVEIE